MRIFHAILPGHFPRQLWKGEVTFFHPLPCRPFEQDRSVLSSSSRFPTGQQQDKPANMTEHILHLLEARQASQHDRVHILSLCFLAAGRTSQHERPHSLFFTDWLYLTYFEQSAKHHEESTPNSWAVGVWEIILSAFIFPSKPTDPWRNRLDIFNSCFNFSILIPVLMTASQL